MKRIILLGMVLLSVFFMNILPSHAYTNVALGKNVTLDDASNFYKGGWSSTDTGGPPATLTDGLFFEEGHQWDQGTVYWNVNYNKPQNAIVNLDGEFKIYSFTVQVDNNEAYQLYYKDGNIWALAWDIPIHGGWGIYTQSFTLSSPITTSALLLTNAVNSGDEWKSVSEIQAFGIPTPIPAAVWLLGSGLFGLFSIRRKITK